MKIVALLAVSLVAALVSAQQPVNCRSPLTEAQLTDLIKNLAEKRQHVFVQKCGVSFVLTDPAKNRLRAAGASAELIEEIQAHGPKKAADEKAIGFKKKKQEQVQQQPTPQQLQQQAELALWEAIKDSRTTKPFEDYLKRYPSGRFAAAAKARAATIRADALRGQIRQALQQQRWDMAEAEIKELERITGEEQGTRDLRQSLALARQRQEQQRQFLQQQEIAAGTTWVNPKDGLTYVWIPPGTFTMGCSWGDAECDDDEKPAHRVTITHGLWIGQTEVTQAAYQRAMGTNPSHFQGTNLPVETISWNEAQTYCEAVGMRLPTEAEWEYAARAGGTSARYGDLDAIAWYFDNSGRQTHEVARKEPNAWGLYDMLGNVWEWVADWHADYAAGSQSDPHGPASGTYRVLRGGSWDNNPRFARASFRGWSGPGNRFNRFGVRCAAERIPYEDQGTRDSQQSLALARQRQEQQRPPQIQQQQENAAGTTKVNPKDGLTYVWIPPGTFTMGCSPGDAECFADEKPAHHVTITKGFWIGQTEVTEEAYQRAMGNNPRSFNGTNFAVETISWNEAQRYCGAVGMRLPTEAEWEYAARAGGTGARYGDLDAIAWYAGNSGSHTYQAGRKQPNAWGLYDVLGNVWEWVADWYADYPAGGQSDPHGPASGTYRVLRGGSGGDGPRTARASDRFRNDPELRSYDIGVRCAGN